MPQISVVLPVHNGGEHLERTLESILNQTFGGFELLAVNDGSADNTQKILEYFQARDPRICILRNERNLGIVHALNRGLYAAKGKYIARIDCGDLCVPTRFEEQHRFLEEHPEYVLVGSQAFLTDKEFKPLGIRKYPGENSAMKRLLYLRLNPIIHPSVMFRRMNGIFYDPLFEYVEDHDLWFRLGMQGKFKNLAKPLIYYQLHDGISQKKRIYQIKMPKLVRQKWNSMVGNQRLHHETLAAIKEGIEKDPRENERCRAYVERHRKATFYKLRKKFLRYFLWKMLSILLYPAMLMRLLDTVLVAASLPVNRYYRKWRAGF